MREKSFKQKIFFGLIFCLVTLSNGILAPSVFATSSGPNGPGAVTQHSDDEYAGWMNPTNIQADDDLYAETIWSTAPQVSDKTIQLSKTGELIGNNKATGAVLPLNEWETRNFGGETDVWGASLTPNYVNSSDFGVSIQYTHDGYDTAYLEATNFGFAVPSNATIDGISVSVEHRVRRANPYAPYYPNVDYVSMTVFYTLAANTAPNSPTLVSPANASYTNDNTPPNPVGKLF